MKKVNIGDMTLDVLQGKIKMVDLANSIVELDCE